MFSRQGAGMRVRLTLSRLLVGLALALFLPRSVAAHPHVFIDDSVAVMFDASGAAAIRLTWTFDEMYSSMLRHDYTSGKPGELSAADIENIRKNAFSNLMEYGYFLAVRLNHMPVRIVDIVDFDASFAAGRMTYRFSVPLRTATETKNTLEIAVFDPEYYVDFRIAAKHPVTIEGGAARHATCSVVAEQKQSIGWGVVAADTVVCTYAGNTG
jgi:ABC-type uncharacterized transport system substrate-binding protein